MTVAQWRACVAAGVCPHLEDTYSYKPANNYLAREPDHPIMSTWDNVRTFAHWVGAELPSRYQWEYAASSRGETILTSLEGIAECLLGDLSLGSSMYYNNHYGPEYYTCNGTGTSPVCSFPNGDTLQGLCDMFGNIDEALLDDPDRFRGRAIHLDGSARCLQVNCERVGNKPAISTYVSEHWGASSSFGLRLYRRTRHWEQPLPTSE